MIWSEVQITTTTEAEDAVAEAFYEAGAGGVVIESLNDVEGLWGDPTVGYIDETLLERPMNTSMIRGYFPVEAGTDEKIQDILLKIARLPEYGLDPGSGELKIVEIEDENWGENWKKYFLATHVTDDIVIVPSWEEYNPNGNECIIFMDPGMAFGTGTHETTRLCIELLERYLNPEDSVIDVGCGTAILSIVAAKLGSQEVVGIDLDGVAVQVARENVEKNHVEEAVEIVEGDLLNGITTRADLIIANILPDPILTLLPDVKNVAKADALLILSGIIESALPVILTALEENGFKTIEVISENEWYAIVARER